MKEAQRITITLNRVGAENVVDLWQSASGASKDFICRISLCKIISSHALDYFLDSKLCPTSKETEIATAPTEQKWGGCLMLH
jgi:hypothetical protein